MTSLADETGIAEMDQALRKRYDLKRGGVLGPEETDQKEVVFLNRVFRYTDRGTLEIDSDQRNVAMLPQGPDARGLSTPAVKTSLEGLSCARAAYLSLDRPDVGRPSRRWRGGCRTPTADLETLKRLG
eukprot:2442675-Amphidinium_carterae.1